MSSFSAMSCFSISWSPRRSASAIWLRSSRWRRFRRRPSSASSAPSTWSTSEASPGAGEWSSALARCARSSSVAAASSGFEGAGALASASSRSAVARSAIHAGCSASWVEAMTRAGFVSGSTSARSRTRSVSVSGSARCAGMLAVRCAAACFSSWRISAESMPSFCAASAANSSRWMGLGMRRMCGSRKLSDFTLASAVRAGKQLTRPLDQVVGVAARAAQGRAIRLNAPFAHKAVGVEPAFQRHHLDVEVLLGQQRNGFLRRRCAGGVRIEVDDDAAW